MSCSHVFKNEVPFSDIEKNIDELKGSSMEEIIDVSDCCTMFLSIVEWANKEHIEREIHFYYEGKSHFQVSFYRAKDDNYYNYLSFAKKKMTFICQNEKTKDKWKVVIDICQWNYDTIIQLILAHHYIWASLMNGIKSEPPYFTINNNVYYWKKDK